MHYLSKCLVVLLVLSLSSCILNRDFTPNEKDKLGIYKKIGHTKNSDNPVKVVYFGTSSLLISDQSTKILIDGFVSRPSIMSLIIGTKPDEERIEELIAKYDLKDKLNAVIPVHSHHDHAMDASIFARETGADLIGTRSIFNIQDTKSVKQTNVVKATLNQIYRYGNFQITLLDTRHGKIPSSLLRAILGMEDDIEEPIDYPARLWDYKEGQPFSILIRRGSESMLVHASTSFSAGSLKEVKADWVFLGIANLHKLNVNEQTSYFNETVSAVEATRVVPIHWDDIFRSSRGKLYPSKIGMGNFSKELSALECQMLMYKKESALRLMEKEDVIYLDNKTDPIMFPIIKSEIEGCPQSKSSR